MSNTVFQVEYCATRDCEDKQCNDAYLDVCFLVHVTDDTKDRDFNRIKRFIKSCQTHLGNLGDEDMQFCLYQYNAGKWLTHKTILRYQYYI